MKLKELLNETETLLNEINSKFELKSKGEQMTRLDAGFNFVKALLGK